MPHDILGLLTGAAIAAALALGGVSRPVTPAATAAGAPLQTVEAGAQLA